MAYFGPQTKKLLTLINVIYYINIIKAGDTEKKDVPYIYISALRGCCPMKLLYALQIDQGYLAHTPTRTGVPPKI